VPSYSPAVIVRGKRGGDRKKGRKRKKRPGPHYFTVPAKDEIERKKKGGKSKKGRCIFFVLNPENGAGGWVGE